MHHVRNVLFFFQPTFAATLQQSQEVVEGLIGALGAGLGYDEMRTTIDGSFFRAES